MDIIWLPLDASAHPDAVRKLLPQANSAWWTDGHPGWQFLPLTVAHLPAYGEGGQPASLTSSFTFTLRPTATVPGQGAAAGMSGMGLPAGVPQGLAGTGGLNSAGSLPLPTAPPSSSAFSTASAAGMAGLPGLPLAGGLPGALPGALPGLLPLQGMPTLGAAGAAAPALFGAAVDPGLQPLLGFGSSALLPANMALPALQPAASGSGMSADVSAAAASGDPGLGPQPDSLSPFEDPSFQQLMSAVAANGAASAPASESVAPAARASAPTSGYGASGRGSPPGSSDSGQVKRKADTSLETWIAAHKSLDFDFSLPPNLAQLSSLFTSLMMGGEMGGGAPLSVPEQKQARREGPPGSGGLAGLAGLAGLGAGGPAGAAALHAGGAAAVAAPVLTQPLQPLQQQQQQVQQQHAQQVQQQQRQPAPAPLLQPAQQQPAPATSQPASLVGVSMEEMQGMFAKAARQEISYAELEAFLKVHNLLPPGGGGGSAAASQSAGKQEQQLLPAQAAPAVEDSQSEGMGMEPSFGPDVAARGLEDMKSIEMAMPAISSGGQGSK